MLLQSPQSIEIISTMKMDKKLQIFDADWASAEHSVIMFSDYSIRVFDLKLTKSYSSIYSYEFGGKILILIIKCNLILYLFNIVCFYICMLYVC